MRKHAAIYIILLAGIMLSAVQTDSQSITIGGQKAAFKAHYKGMLLYHEGSYERAVQQFEKAYDILPDNYHFVLSLAVALSRVGATDEALRMMRKTASMLPENDPAYEQKAAYRDFFEGMILTYGGRFGEAIKPLKSSLEKQQQLGDTKLLSIYNNALGYAIMLNQGGSDHGSDTLGMHYHVHKRDMLKSLPYFDNALKLDSKNKAALHNYFLIRNTLGLENMKEYYDNQDSSLVVVEGPLPENTDRALQFAEYEELLFLLDISGSMVMENVPCMGNTRFDVMKETALFVLDSLPASTLLGLGSIDGDCGTEPVAWDSVGALSHYDMRYRLRFLAPNGTTPLLERLQDSPGLFTPSKSSQKAIFLISDGANVCRVPGADICGWAMKMAERNITINVLTFLDANRDNSNAFAEYGCLAANTGGQILYLDNYRCSYEYFGAGLAESCLPQIPNLRKVSCWGPAVKELWAVEVK